MRLLQPSNNFTFTLFLNLVTKWFTHFEKDVCWVQKANVTNNYHLPIQFNNSDYAYTRQVINPVDCVPGCDYYILHDPVSNQLEEYIRNCIINNKKFKAIVFQTRDRFDQYNMWMVYAQSSIFVSTDLDTLVIEKFTDWKLTKTRVLNVWSKSENAFVHPVNLEQYFDEKMYNNAKLLTFIASTYNPSVVYKPEVMSGGIHLRILEEFTKKINVGCDIFASVPKNSSRYLAWFVPGQFGGELLSTIINRNKIGFLVPKKRICVNMTNIIEVFQWEFWMCTFVLYFTICAYLIVEKYLGTGRIERIKLPVKLFCMQALSAHEIAGSRRAKFVLLLLFFFASWFSILFNYGVLHSLMTPKYENDIQTWKDMDKANLPLYWHRDPLQFNTHNDAAVKNVLSRWVKNSSILEDRQKSIQVHYISENGLSTLLRDYDLANDQVISLDNLFGTVNDYIGVSPSIMPHIDDLNDLILLSKESGLMKKWEWEAFLLTTKVFTILEYIDKNSPPEATAKLTLDHLLGVFCGLAIGLSLAIIVFFIECCIKLKQQRFPSKQLGALN